jgi:hypothetical protein
VERTAIQPPKACFGLEQTYGNPLCRDCPYRRDCAEIMGHLANRLHVDEARFTFMPPAFVAKSQDSSGLDPDLPHLESVYVFCHEWVFGRELRGKRRDVHVQFLKKHGALIRERIREANTSVKLFLLATLLQWQRTRSETPFHPRFLINEFASHQVRVLAKACQRQFGTFDVTALDSMMSSDIARQDFETLILNSEIVAGAWIIGYKLFHSGEVVSRLYAEKEISLNPYWLAIEPTYRDRILVPHLDNPGLCESKIVRDHRWNVVQVLARLKKQERKAMAVFRARERMMPLAVQTVLSQRGLLPEHFDIENVPVVNALKFWVRLGNAIQHYECLKFVDNYPSVFDGHFTRG